MRARRYRALRAKTSPGRMAGFWAMIALTLAPIRPRWTGMCAGRWRWSPLASKTAQRKGAAILIVTHWQPCSRAPPLSVRRSTCRVVEDFEQDRVSRGAERVAGLARGMAGSSSRMVMRGDAGAPARFDQDRVWGSTSTTGPVSQSPGGAPRAGQAVSIHRPPRRPGRSGRCRSRPRRAASPRAQLRSDQRPRRSPRSWAASITRDAAPGSSRNGRGGRRRGPPHRGRSPKRIGRAVSCPRP